MQTMDSLTCHWSRPIFAGNGWNSADDLINYLQSVSENAYLENTLPQKAVFIQSIRRLIVSIELDGDAVKEAKQMTSPGSMFESLSSDYLFLRSRYLQKRKRLKEQLRLISKLRQIDS